MLTAWPTWRPWGPVVVMVTRFGKPRLGSVALAIEYAVPTPAMVTVWFTPKPWGAAVVIVTLLPASVAPLGAARIEAGLPPTPAIVTNWPIWKPWPAAVVMVTVVPASVALVM